jgi:hypothetical protein
MELGGHLHTSAALSPGKDLQDPLNIMRTAVRRAGLDDLENRNNLRPSGMNSGFSVIQHIP